MYKTDPKIHEVVVSKIKTFWKEKPIATGIPLIDLQHIWLIYIIFQLEEILNLEDHESMINIINKSFLDVLDYTVEHFGIEEELMKQFAYPELEEHTKTHQEFIEKLKGKFESFEFDEVIAHGLLSILKKWLINHILEDDKDYSKFFVPISENIKSHCATLLNSKKITVTKIQIELYRNIISDTETDIRETKNDDIHSQIRKLWKSYNLSIHIPLIDLQHIWLLRIIVDLDYALKNREASSDDEKIKKLFWEAVKYTEEHFMIEEKLMKQFRFTDLINHSNQHKRFIQFVKKRSDELKSGDGEAAEHLVLDLKNWLLSHIAFEDRKIGILIKDKVSEISEFTKKIHQSGDLVIRPEQKTVYKEVMKS